jgi:hypothetical protein
METVTWKSRPTFLNAKNSATNDSNDSEANEISNNEQGINDQWD